MAQKKSASVQGATKVRTRKTAAKAKNKPSNACEMPIKNSLTTRKSVDVSSGSEPELVNSALNRSGSSVKKIIKNSARRTKTLGTHSSQSADAVKIRSHGFKPKDFIVYPAHGVGQIIEIEVQEIAGLTLELFVITFEKDKMTLRVPTDKFESVGMRKLAESKTIEKAMSILKGRARVKRAMWSRRAQEYETKINSGDLISVSEVVRDLYRSDNQPEQSYSERQLYEQALDRMSREIAIVKELDDRRAIERITDILSISAKNRQSADEKVGDGNVRSDVEAA
ncbi:MAG: CarD family transcriptional regulator [Hyphomicrobiaceae bacterium]|nr:CarD family transcriptional regulator [Hyphomicrobiaceae bacterium]